MAAVMPAHLTLIYPLEIDDPKRLAARAGAAASAVSAFRIRLGGFAAFPPPDDGCVYMAVEDVEEGFAALRRAALEGVDGAIDFPPHLTLIHPKTSGEAYRFWAEPPPCPTGELVFDAVDVTAFDGKTWRSVERFALSGD